MDIRYISTLGYDFYHEEVVCSGIAGSGSIELEYGWNLIAVPVEYGYYTTASGLVHDETTRAKVENYIVDQIEDLYATATGIENVVEVCNTYIGDNQFFWNYTVGSTPESSPHNFQLVYDDGVHREISGFWIKIIGSNAPYVIYWGEQ